MSALLPSVASITKNIVKELSKTVKKSKTKKKKNGKSSFLAAAPSTLAGTTKSPSVNVAGVAIGVNSVRRVPNYKLPPFTIQVNQLSQPISTTSTGLAVFGYPSSSIYAFDFNPQNAPTSGYYAFGKMVYNVSDSFFTFKVNKLRVVYNPACSTTTPGMFCIGYSRDPFTNAGAAPSVIVIGSLSDNMPFAPWEMASMDITNLDTREKYVTQGTNASDPSSQRLDAAGSLLISSYNTGASLYAGLITFIGSITFMDGGDQTTIQNDLSVKRLMNSYLEKGKTFEQAVADLSDAFKEKAKLNSSHPTESSSSSVPFIYQSSTPTYTKVNEEYILLKH